MNNKLECEEKIVKFFNDNNYKYYEFSQTTIKNIVKKYIRDVTNKEWRILLQMLYPKNMIGSGLFQPILIFELYKNGKRKDPPIEAYNAIDEIKRENNLFELKKNCLLFKIMDYIEKNSKFKIDESWYKVKEKILLEDSKDE